MKACDGEAGAKCLQRGAVAGRFERTGATAFRLDAIDKSGEFTEFFVMRKL